MTPIVNIAQSTPVIGARLKCKLEIINPYERADPDSIFIKCDLDFQRFGRNLLLEGFVVIIYYLFKTVLTKELWKLISDMLV